MVKKQWFNGSKLGFFEKAQITAMPEYFL